MSHLNLQICTADGVLFDREINDLLARTIVGDICILNGHANYMTSIDYGEVRVHTTEGNTLYGACCNGFLSVFDNKIRLISTTFEFSDKIDLERAKTAKSNAEDRIEKKISTEDYETAKAKLNRALIRISVAEKHKQ